MPAPRSRDYRRIFGYALMVGTLVVFAVMYGSRGEYGRMTLGLVLIALLPVVVWSDRRTLDWWARFRSR